MKNFFRYGLLLLCGILQGAPLGEPLPDIAALHRAYQADPKKNEAAWERAMQILNDRIERQVFEVDETYRKLDEERNDASRSLKAAEQAAGRRTDIAALAVKILAVKKQLKELSPDEQRGREIDLKQRELTSLSREFKFKCNSTPSVKLARQKLDAAEAALGERSRYLIDHSALPVAKVFRDAVTLTETTEKGAPVKFAGCYRVVGDPFNGLFSSLPPELVYARDLHYSRFLGNALKRENPAVDAEKIDKYVKMRTNSIPGMPGDGQAALQPGATPFDEVMNAMIAYHAKTADAETILGRLRMATLKMPRQSVTRFETFRLIYSMPADKQARQNRLETVKSQTARLINSNQVDNEAAPCIYDFYAHYAAKEDWLNLEQELNKVQDANPWLRQMVAGRAAMVRAWKARGGGFSYTVSNDGWKVFKAEFQKARDHFLEAAKLLPETSQPYAEMIEIDAGDGTIDQRIKMFKEVIKRDPTNTDAYVNLTWFILPRWGGSHELILQLADALLEYPDYNTVIPAYAFDAMARVARDYPDYRWKQIYLRDDVVKKGDRLFAERLKTVKQPRWKNFALYHRALFEMATLRYDKAAETVAELGGEKAFSEQFDQNWWSGSGATNWYPRLPSEGRSTSIMLRLFTGRYGKQLQALEKRYLDGDDGVRVELTDLIKTGEFTPDEKDVLIDLLGRWGIDTGLSDYFASRSPVNAFQVAGKEGYPYILEEMLKLGFNYGKYENFPGETAILIAENGTNPELLEVLKKAGDPLNRPEPRNKRAPMHVAAFEPNAIMIKKLLELGVSPTAPDGENHTPVQMAAARRGVEATMLLLAAGADVDVRDNDGDTALMFVMEQNSPRPIWQALIAKSKDLNIANNRGMTALHYAARLTDDPAVIQAMLKAGADPRKADSTGQTPIDVARERGRADFVKLMEAKQ